jgi:hypothetical protein
MADGANLLHILWRVSTLLGKLPGHLTPFYSAQARIVGPLTELFMHIYCNPLGMRTTSARMRPSVVRLDSRVLHSRLSFGGGVISPMRANHPRLGTVHPQPLTATSKNRDSTT